MGITFVTTGGNVRQLIKLPASTFIFVLRFFNLEAIYASLSGMC